MPKIGTKKGQPLLCKGRPVNTAIRNQYAPGAGIPAGPATGPPMGAPIGPPIGPQPAGPQPAGPQPGPTGGPLVQQLGTAHCMPGTTKTGA